jgi:hypothetical protein
MGTHYLNCIKESIPALIEKKENMEECPPKSYDKVTPLLLDAPLLLDFVHHIVLWTLLAGITPGHIYVNDLENPTVAFTQFRRGRPVAV